MKKKTKKSRIKNGFKNIIGGGSVLRVTIAGIMMAAVIVAFYYSLSHRLSSAEELGNRQKDELEICLTQNFVDNYPSSPKDVVRWYNRIITLYYKDKLKDKQLEKLCDQVLCLLDKDLAAENPKNIYYAAIKQEIEEYKARDKKIISHDVGDVNDIRYVTDKTGDDLAYVTSYYFTQEGSSYVSSYQTYCLRRDGTGRYKILAFDVTDERGNRKQ